MPDSRLRFVVGKESIPLTPEETEIVRKNFKIILDKLFENSKEDYALEENMEWKDLFYDQTCFKCRFPTREWRDVETKKYIKLWGINIYVYHKLGYDQLDHEKKHSYFTLSIDPMGEIRRYRCRHWYVPRLNGRNYDYETDVNDLDFSDILNIFIAGKLL